MRIGQILICLAGPGILFMVMAEFHHISGDEDFKIVHSHKEITCSYCHLMTAQTGANYPVNPEFNSRCHDCHTVHVENASESTLNFHNDSRSNCTICHSFHQSERLTVAKNEFSFNYRSPRHKEHCLSCHAPGMKTGDLSPGHKAASSLFHIDSRVIGHLSVSQACQICHSERQSIPQVTVSPDINAPRFADHGSHPVGLPVIPGSGKSGNKVRKQLDSRIHLVGNRIECITCHRLTSKNQFLLAGFSNPNDLCRGCHQLD